MSENLHIKILVAPLDWGLGHATRCIPIITQLLKLGCKVIIAAEGVQEKLLKTEFPDIDFVNLQGYRIKYANTKRFFSIKILLQLPKIFLSIQREKAWLHKFLIQTPVHAVISDNRYGLYHPDIPSIFITHQLLIKAPFSLLEKAMQKINYQLIENFSACWVPDEKGKVNMAGLLSHQNKLPEIPITYLGGLSRLNKQQAARIKFKILVIISGPEPQRGVLENIILTALINYEEPVLFVRGLPSNEAIIQPGKNITVENHLSAKELEKAFNESELIISRSGYTTVMDLFKLQKKAVLIPTPGQTEQEYLADHLQKESWCIKIDQDEFSLKELNNRIKHFEYKFPQWDMETYKDVVNHFIKGLTL